MGQKKIHTMGNTKIILNKEILNVAKSGIQTLNESKVICPMGLNSQKITAHDGTEKGAHDGQHQQNEHQEISPQQN